MEPTVGGGVAEDGAGCRDPSGMPEPNNETHGVQVPMSKHDTQPDADGAPPLEMGIQSHLGRSLRRVYDQTLTEPIPDRFLSLMSALEAIEPVQDEPKQAPRSPRGKTGAVVGAARTTERRA